MDTDIISTLKHVSSSSCKYPLKLKAGASFKEIQAAENRLGLKLPAEICSFYSFSNGAEGDDLIFNILPVEELTWVEDEHGRHIVFSEYLIWSETCAFVPNLVNPDSFSVVRRIGITFVPDYNFPDPICYSLCEYVLLYSEGGVFGIWS